MLIYEKDIDGNVKLFGSVQNIPTPEDKEIVLRDAEGNQLEIVPGDSYVDNGHGGMTRRSDGKFVAIDIITPELTEINVIPGNYLFLTTVPAQDSDGELFGKLASELQNDIEIEGNSISGTLNYVTDYTQFSSKTEEQEGNYLAIKCTAIPGATITVELINGTLGHPVTLDPDGLIVLRITDKDTQSIQVVTSSDGVTETKNYALTDLVLTPNA